MGDINLKTALGGQIALTPTNTASNYTVTVPAATGTVLLAGATNPTGNLTLTTPSTTTAAYLNWTNGTGTVASIGGYSDSTTTGHLEFYTLASGTTPTEQVRITSDGNIGVGTSSTSSGYGSGKSIMLTNTSSILIQNASNTWNTTTAGAGFTYWSDSNLYIDAKDSAANIIFRTNGATERMRILATGNILSLSGGSTSATGTGIAFPASASLSSDVNTLDDYEEGTWTPDIYNSSSSSTWTTRTGQYRKIGSQVTCWFVLDGGNSGTAGSNLRAGGLPFTVSMNGNNMGVGIWGANNLTPQSGNFIQNSSIIYVYNGGAALTAQTSFICGMFTYLTTQ